MTATREAAQDRFIQVGNVRTRYREVGSGTTLLMLHGIGRSLEDWSENMSAFGKSHRAVALDLVGFGRTDKPDVPYSADYLRDFTARFMDALGVPKAVLVGNSMGGAVALRMALTQPERVEKLVLVAPGGLGKRVAQLLSLCTVPVLGEWLTQAKPDDTDGQRRVLQACFHNQACITEEQVKLAHELAQLPGRQNAFLKTLRASCNWRGARSSFLQTTLARLPELEVPTLVVWGKQDHILPSEYLENARRIPGVQTHLFDPCGHFPQLERPHEFNALVTSFLRGEPVLKRN